MLRTDFFLLVESVKFVPDIKIYGGVYTENEKKNHISGDPAQCKTVPQRPDRKITVGTLAYICIAAVDECK